MKKIDTRSKLKKLILRSAFLGIMLAVASAAAGQSISLSMSDVTTREVIEKLQKDYGYSFTIRTANLQMDKRISVSVQDAGINAVLEKIFAGQGVAYAVDGKIISVTEASQVRPRTPDRPKTLTGVVVDDQDVPIIGAAVVIKGTSLGVSTGTDGSFRLQTTEENPVLLVSYLGMSTAEVPVANTQDHLRIKMVPEARVIEDVVVTALGITREQKSLGYAVTKIDSETINSTVSSNWLNSLSGKVAGLNFDSASAGPGGSIRVTLRGESSLSHDNNGALFVIDGVPVSSDQTNFGSSAYSNSDAPVDFGNGASDLNPEDIESVTVLKGPSATALYGSRAANGAIIITTKTGRSSKGIGVTVNSSVVFEKAGFWPDFQTEYGAGNASNTSRPNSNGLDAARYYGFWDVPAAESYDGERHRRLQSRYGYGPRYEGQLFYTYESYDWETGTYTPQEWRHQDYYKGFFETGVTYTNSVSVDGNNGKGTTVRFSARDVRSDWIVPNTGYTSQNFNVSVQHEMNKYIKANAKVTYYRKNSDNLPTAGYDPSSPIHALVWTVPGVSIKALHDEWASGRIPQLMEAGEGNKLINNGSGSARSENAYWIANESLNSLDRDRVYGSMSVTAQIKPWLSLMVRSGMDFNHDFSTQRKPQYTYSYPDGYYREMTTDKLEMNNDFLLSFDKTYSDLTVSASFGGNNMVYRYRNSSQTATRLSIPNEFFLQNSVSELRGTPVRREKSINSFYGIVSLGYKDTYYLDITGRNDWTSTLPRTDNSYFYPSVSLSILLEEVLNLREKTTWVNMLKIRGSWANVGNDTAPYKTRHYYSNGLFSGSYYMNTSLENPNLKPENVESWEAGIEARLFKGVWSFDAAFYNSASTKQIISVPTEAMTGAQTEMINAGKVRNRGIELSTTVKPISGRDFNWTINFNWSKNWNKLVELADDVEVWQVNSNTVGSRVYIYAYPGQELGRIYGWGYQRAPKGSFYLDSDGNRVDCSNQVVVDPTTGNPIIEEELKDFGSIYPDWKAGFSQTFRYKNLSLSMTLQGQLGGQCYSVTNMALSYQGKLTNSLAGRYTGLVHEGVNLNSDGSYSENTKITTDIVDYYNNFVHARQNVENNVHSTSYLKFKELRVDYSLPQRICDKTGFIQGASIGFFATNLFCITNFPQYDPDAASMNGSSISRGIESAAYPMTRSYGINLKLTF